MPGLRRGDEAMSEGNRLHRPPVRLEPSIIPMDEQHTQRVKTLWKERFGAPEETIDNWVEDVLKEGKPTEGFVASDGGNVLGFGIAACCTPEYVEKYINHPDIEVEAWPKTGLLHMLCVDKEHEERGIGTSLVEKRIQWLASQGVGGILAVSWHRENYRDSRPLLEKYLDPVVTADDFYETSHGEGHCVDCEGVCKCGATIFKRSLQPGTDHPGPEESDRR